MILFYSCSIKIKTLESRATQNERLNIATKLDYTEKNLNSKNIVCVKS